MIRNLDSKTQYCQTQPSTLFLSSISILQKKLKDKNNKNKDLKVKIYNFAIKTMSLISN